MNTVQKRSFKPLYLSLLILVLTSNILLYRSPLQSIIPTNTQGVVLGSLLDFTIVAPFLVLALTRKKGFTLKRFITFMVIGAIAARFIIPSHYFEPFKYVPIAALGLELILLIAELSLIFMLIRKVPSIIRDIREQSLSPLFSFSPSVEKSVSKHPLVQIISAEILMVYYAFATWKKKANEGSGYFTLHKNSSMTAIYVMLIHAIAIETIGFHWWLHEKSMILSIVLLILNVYSIIYIVADIHAVRLNPLKVEDEKIYVSLGLGKRIVIPFGAISSIHWGEEAAKVNLKDKSILPFIAQDFETLPPNCLIELKSPIEATLFMGIKKPYSTVAIKLDDPHQFKVLIELTC